MSSLGDASMWHLNKTRLAILVPTRDMIHSQFAFCLAQMMKTNTEAGIETFLFFDSSTILLNQREHLVEEAKAIKADYVLWLDSDMSFPSTTAIRLLNHRVDVVAANYNRRTLPIKTVAYTNINDWDSWLPMEEENELIPVQGVGMGCMLMNIKCFYDIEKPYFRFQYNGEQDDWLGEDFNMQKKIRNAKYEILIDTVLSMDIKHMGMYPF